MNKLGHFLILYILLLAGLCIVGCQTPSPPLPPAETINESPASPITIAQPPDLSEQLLSKYQAVIPQQWGEQVSGVAYRLDTQERVLALTLDACGGSDLANGFDADLIDYLQKMQIPATLFVSGQWIDANQSEFLVLANRQNFVIGNHGLKHLPCSVSGKSAYHIKGTGSVAEVIQEVSANGVKIAGLIGRKPLYYRSGTDYYDEVGLAVARDLGYVTIGYSVAGDAGATFNREQVKKTLLEARAGSIILMHFNHPEGQTAEGALEAIPILQQQGFKFVQLSDYPLVTYP